MYNSLLTAFVRVADSGSFNKAAEALYVSPPAVMKQINALETHLDMKLLERTNHGVRLTPAGQGHLPPCALSVRVFGARGRGGASRGGSGKDDLLHRQLIAESM